MNHFSYNTTVNVSGAYYNYNNRVTLDTCQMISGDTTAVMRQQDSWERQSQQARNLPEEQSDYTNRIGCLGEVAVFVGLGRHVDGPYYHSVGEFSQPDCWINGKPVNIKTSPRHPNLLVSVKHLSASRYYIGVQHISEREYALLGWISGKEILRHPEWERNPGNRGACYIVPFESLHYFKDFLTPESGANG